MTEHAGQVWSALAEILDRARRAHLEEADALDELRRIVLGPPGMESLVREAERERTERAFRAELRKTAWRPLLVWIGMNAALWIGFLIGRFVHPR